MRAAQVIITQSMLNTLSKPHANNRCAASTFHYGNSDNKSRTEAISKSDQRIRCRRA
jgi:hypothetical protein